MLGMAGRSRERHPAVLTEALDLSKCISCGQCAVVCPVGAITERSEWRQVQEELDAQRKARAGCQGAACGPALAARAPVCGSLCILKECGCACQPGLNWHSARQFARLTQCLIFMQVMICVTAPAVRVAIGEEVGLAPGSITTGQMVTAQRELGFSHVFDVNFAGKWGLQASGAGV